MRKIIKAFKKISFVQIVVAILVIASITVTIIWAPRILILGEYFLIRTGILIMSIFLIQCLLSVLQINKLSKYFPRWNLLLKTTFTLTSELIIWFGAFTVLTHFNVITLEDYLFQVLIIIWIVTIVLQQSFLYKISLQYENNSKLKWEELIN